MNHTPLLTSQQALEEVLAVLRAHQLMPSSLHLIGLLGVGNNATVFAADIGGVHHVVKVYASKERMLLELTHLRRVSPRGRRLLTWTDEIEGFDFYFFIHEIPAGRPLMSADLSTARIASLSERLLALHRVRYQQTVSVAGLKRRLQKSAAALGQCDYLGLKRTDFDQLYRLLEKFLDQTPELFAVPKSRIHGDLWWPNIIATDGEAYLIDWDELTRADPAEDIARLRLHIWRSQNSFPSRNFFWSSAGDGLKVKTLIEKIVRDHEAEIGGGLASRLQFYMPLYGLEQLAALARGRSTTEPVLRPSLYRLMAHDSLQLAADPFASPPDFRDSQYYDLVKRSRTQRLDGKDDD
ncbi:MAG: hypothetical protein NVSMB39_2150 [Candidatus Saccharimonadales bacterium]